MGIIDFFKRMRNADGQDAEAWDVQQREMSSDLDVQRTRTVLLSFTVVGLAGLFLFTATSISPFSWAACAKLSGTGLLYAGAFYGVGALGGFLFGIPRSLQGKFKSIDKSSELGESPQARYAANTNLEEISDWLTKIIVGLGLVNLKSVPDLLKRAARYFANSCGKDMCESVAMAVIIYFSICGFFLGYLMARLYLTKAFIRAEREETVEPIGSLPGPTTVPVTVSGSGSPGTGVSG